MKKAIFSLWLFVVLFTTNSMLFAQASIMGDTLICGADQSASYTVQNPPTSANRYVWTSSTSGTFDFDNTSSVTTTTPLLANRLTIVPSSTTITVRIFENLTLLETATLKVRVQSVPSLSANNAFANPNQSEITTCENSVQLNALLSNASFITEWSVVSGSGSFSDNTPKATFSNIGLGENILQWKVGGTGSCINSFVNSTVKVVRNRKPGPAQVSSGEITPCDTLFSVAISAQNPTYGIGKWTTNSTSITIQDAENPIASVSNISRGGSYLLTWTVSDPAGLCPAVSDVMRLKPLECSPLFIPSGFNESTQFWKIDGLTNYANVSVKLYDRWGDEVFTNTDNYAANPFDGTSKGTPLPSGVYYYVISADGLTKTGTLTLLR